MTILIAKNTKDKIILGADTCAFQDYFKKRLDKKNMPLKILSENGMTFSSTGSYSESINFSLFCSTRKPESSKILSIQRFFLDFQKFLKENCFSERIENNYFFVFEKKLFHYAFSSVREITEDNYECDGAGYKEAEMAMFLGKDVKEAIEITIEFNVWTSGEVQIVEILK